MLCFSGSEWTWWKALEINCEEAGRLLQHFSQTQLFSPSLPLPTVPFALRESIISGSVLCFLQTVRHSSLHSGFKSRGNHRELEVINFPGPGIPSQRCWMLSAFTGISSSQDFLTLFDWFCCLLVLGLWRLNRTAFQPGLHQNYCVFTSFSAQRGQVGFISIIYFLLCWIPASLEEDFQLLLELAVMRWHRQLFVQAASVQYSIN